MKLYIKEGNDKLKPLDVTFSSYFKMFIISYALVWMASFIIGYLVGMMMYEV